MVKHGVLKDPAQDIAAADVLAAFEAAQFSGSSSVDCYHAAVDAGVTPIPIIRLPTRLSRRSGSFSTQDESADRGNVMAARRQCAVSMSRSF